MDNKQKNDWVTLSTQRLRIERLEAVRAFVEQMKEQTLTQTLRVEDLEAGLEDLEAELEGIEEEESK